MIVIAQTDPRDSQAMALLEQSHALMMELFAPEHNSFLEIDDLCVPSVIFFTAREGDVVLGTAALAGKDGYGEVKSMFVAPEARGKGVAQALLRQLEDLARHNEFPELRLETGDTLVDAIRLYTAFGFEPCGPFGEYTENGVSVFMRKAL